MGPTFRMLAATLPMLAAPVGAQAPALGSIRGTVTDSLTGRPLAGAAVEVAGVPRTTVADRNGRFRMDSGPAGSRRLTFSAPSLDSVGLYGFARVVAVSAGRETRADLATPSFATMHARLCGPGAGSARDSAILFGTVRDAATGDAVRDARVRLAWFAVRADSGVRLVEVSREATSGDDGTYGLCGVPADLSLATQAVAGSRASGRVTTVVGESRILRRDLLVSDEVPIGDSASTRGRAVVEGTVADERGRPVANALVLLSSADVPVRTGESGQYRIVNAPSGTHEIGVRLVGRTPASQLVDLRPGRVTPVSFRLARVTELATVNVHGARAVGADQKGFLDRKRMGFGRFLEAKEIAKRPDLASALARLPGLRVVREGMGFRIELTRSSNCTPRIVIDGDPRSPLVRPTSIPSEADIAAGLPAAAAMTPLEVINPRDVLGIEFYPGGGGFVPMLYASGAIDFCGTLMIWTVFSRW